MRSYRTVALLLGLALGCTGCGSHAATEPIVIGHLTPDPDRGVGKQAKQGVQLAVDEVNAEENRIAGRRVTVLHVDCRGDADKVQGHAVRLITVNKVTALLADTDAAQADELGRSAKAYDVPVLASTMPAATQADNLFVTGLTPALQGEALARFVKDGLEPHVRNVLVLSDNRQDRNNTLTEAFATELKGSVRVEKKNFRSDADIPDLGEQIQKTQPEAVLIVAAAPEFVQKLRGKAQNGKSPMTWLYAGEEWQKTALQEDHEGGKGIYLATAYAVDDAAPKSKEFGRKYKEQFKQDPDVHAALAYDDARLLFEAMRRAKTISPARVREELAQLETFEGVTGTLTFAKDHTVRRPVFIVGLEGGRPRLLKRDAGGK